jgi:hypothetical protein
MKDNIATKPIMHIDFSMTGHIPIIELRGFGR